MILARAMLVVCWVVIITLVIAREWSPTTALAVLTVFLSTVVHAICFVSARRLIEVDAKRIDERIHAIQIKLHEQQQSLATIELPSRTPTTLDRYLRDEINVIEFDVLRGAELGLKKDILVAEELLGKRLRQSNRVDDPDERRACPGCKEEFEPCSLNLRDRDRYCKACVIRANRALRRAL